MDYLYNGVRLPQLPTPPLDDMDGTIIRYVTKDGVKYAQIVYNLFGYDPAWTDGQPKIGPLYKSGSTVAVLEINPTSTYPTVYNYHMDGGTEWVQGELERNYRTYGTDDLVWSDHDIINVDDGTVFLAASDPIPVSTTDPQSLTAGWLVGKKIAGMRK